MVFLVSAVGIIAGAHRFHFLLIFFSNDYILKPPLAIMQSQLHNSLQRSEWIYMEWWVTLGHVLFNIDDESTADICY